MSLSISTLDLMEFLNNEEKPPVKMTLYFLFVSAHMNKHKLTDVGVVYLSYHVYHLSRFRFIGNITRFAARFVLFNIYE